MKAKDVPEVLQALRDQGFYVDVEHQRYKRERRAAIRGGGYYFRPIEGEYATAAWPKGGKTVVVIREKKDSPVLVRSEAVCSFADNFNRKTGLSIALGRAVALLRQKELL